jgi:predicted lipoprotein with Yx(FWY)xxD motif
MTSTATDQRAGHRADTLRSGPGNAARPLLLIAPTAAALALAACASSSGHTARPNGAQINAASRAALALPQPATHARASHRGRVIKVRASRYGRILSDGSNRTIYLFTHDQTTASTCYGSCAAAWPPVLTRGAPKAGPGLSDQLGTTRRRNGTLQVTYGGHPLYYYEGDVRPGQILCQNVDEFGGTWLVVSPRGAPVR